MSVDTDYEEYLGSQQHWYSSFLPNIIPTNNSAPAPSTINASMMGVDPYIGRSISVHDKINKLFQPGNITANVSNMQQQCESSSVDDLINTQNPGKKIRCGWMYSPPTGIDPLPRVSKSSLGTTSGAFPFLTSKTQYQKWFWNIPEAKEQILTDTCKSLKNCTDVGNTPYGGQCGYCIDRKQGVPVDTGGKALYPNKTMTYCNTPSIITSASACPPPPPVIPIGSGPAPQINNTCTPINGKLSLNCVKSLLLDKGCSTKGSLYTALKDGASPTDYLLSAKKLHSMQTYNNYASHPLDMTTIRQGNATISQVLQQFDNLLTNANTKPPTSGIGSGARDLCLQRGAISQFDFCSELQPTSLPPYDIQCIQKLFLRNGGQQGGSMYPSTSNMASFYNLLPSWGAVLAYIQDLAANSNNSGSVEGFTTDISYISQRSANMQLRGINMENTMRAGTMWDGLTSKLVHISVGNSSTASGIDIRGDLWVRTQNTWKNIPGPVPNYPIITTSISSDGVLTVLTVPAVTNKPSSGFNAYTWNGNNISSVYHTTWYQVGIAGQDKGLVSISNGSKTNMWGIAPSGNVYFRNNINNRYSQLSGVVFKDISTSFDNVVLGIGIGRRNVWQPIPTDTSRWNPIIGQIPMNSAYYFKKIIIGNVNNVYSIRENDTLIKLQPTLTVSGLYYTSSSILLPLPGKFKNISAGSDGTLVGITTSGSLVQWNGQTWNVIFE